MSGNRKKRKELAVKLFGGKCQKCGYNHCITALSFHHVDPSQKEITLSVAHTVSWSRYVKELNKCVLLCLNCHAEFHNGLWDIKDIPRITLDDTIISIVIPTNRNYRKYRECITKKCLVCGVPYKTSGGSKRKFCSIKCRSFSNRKVTRPPKEQLKIEIETMSWIDIAKKYKVSDNAIRKWARNYNLI